MAIRCLNRLGWVIIITSLFYLSMLSLSIIMWTTRFERIISITGVSYNTELSVYPCSGNITNTCGSVDITYDYTYNSINYRKTETLFFNKLNAQMYFNKYKTPSPIEIWLDSFEPKDASLIKDNVNHIWRVLGIGFCFGLFLNLMSSICLIGVVGFESMLRGPT